MTNPIARREASYLESAARDHAAMGDQVSADNCRKVAAEILAKGERRDFMNEPLRISVDMLKLSGLSKMAINLILKEIRE